MASHDVPYALALTLTAHLGLFGVTKLPAATPSIHWAPLPQNGDKEGEEQPMLDRRFDVPPAPALSVKEAHASFTLLDGYRIECVASEPLIHDPVDIAFDAQGRLWVVEMSALMLDADATGELDPTCAIAVLEDRNRDGIYDHRSEFASELVLPRSVCFVGDGVMAIFPPEIVYLRDTDGDGVADYRDQIDTGINAGLNNPEHAANGLTLGIDNWVYLANHNKRYRLLDNGEWKIESVPQVGQWGLGEDVWGRRVYNYNSAPVHGDLVPTHYLVRNPALGRAQGSNVRWAHDTKVWPGRVNTGVNRGYRRGTLAEDGRLAQYTAACGPEVFTGTNLGTNDVGDVFVCEPSGNLLRQLRMHESNGKPSGTNILDFERREFLVSTDERFRPVNIANGPDGALYIVDLYRGILQHKVFLTSFLRRQIEERQLDKYTGLGRIWRIVHEDSKESDDVGAVDYTQLSNKQLAYCFYKENSWTRKTAQRLLIARYLQEAHTEGIDPAVHSERIATLNQIARDTRKPLAQLHALWTLEGLGGLTEDFLIERLRKENHTKLLAQLIRLSEPFADHPAVRESWQWLIDHDDAEVRWQLAYSLGEAQHPAALGQMVQLLARYSWDNILRTGILSGLHGREADALNRALAHPTIAHDSHARTRLARDFARCIVRHADPHSIRRLADRAAGEVDAELRMALIQGMVDGVPKSPGDRRYRFTAPEPPSLIKLASTKDSKLTERVAHLRSRLGWSAEANPATELPAEHAAAVVRGLQLYADTCGACHQMDGEGLAGLAPPLADSEWLQKPIEKLASIALFGLSGPIEVRGESWNMTMPGWAQLSDHEIADVLSYVTTEWGAEARHVQADEVARVRKKPSP
ncbi:MAG: c-type cytochrome [Planctomycetes bacterium]|nr:c-type cytochrome [Planctomycetota bacterium]